MSDQWHDPDFAQKWDQTTLAGNPTRAEQLDILLSIVQKEYHPGKTILDLGIGSGQVESMIFERINKVDIVGIDSSATMLKLAQQKLRSFDEHYTIIQHDFEDISNLSLPLKRYQIAISVQALHHISHQNKQELFKYVYRILEDDGIFLLFDRIAINTTHLSSLYTTLWNRLEQLTQVKSGWTGEYYLQRLLHKADYPATLEEHIDWLNQTGFHTACLHLHLDRALIAGIKYK